MWDLSSKQASDLAEFLADLEKVITDHGPIIEVDFSSGFVEVDGHTVGCLRWDGEHVRIAEIL
jgi:hypothetical protein